MKNIISTFILLTFAFVTSAQIVDLPDTNFKQALLTLPTVDINNDGKADIDADINNDGEIDQSEADSIRYISFSNQSIDSVTGIDHFVNLKSLSLNKNKIKKLSLEDLILLEYINVDSNYLDKFELNNLTSLKTIRVKHTKYQSGNIQEFTFKNLPKLTTIQGLLYLNSIYLENIPLLAKINIDECNLAEFRNLTKLNSFNFSNKVKTLILTDLPNLFNNIEFVYAVDSFIIRNSLTSGTFNLTCPNAKYVELRDLKSTSKLFLDGSQIQELKIIDLPVITEIGTFNNNINYIFLDNLEILDVLKIPDNKISRVELKSVQSLTELDYGGNNIENIELKELINLKYLYGDNNSQSILDISNLIKLEVLHCYNNNLSNLNISSLINLTDLNCSNNPLLSLDVSPNLMLYHLSCSNTLIKELNINNLRHLVIIDASYNESLNFLRIESLEKIKDIQCSGNTTLHLRKIGPLRVLKKIGGSVIIDNALYLDSTVLNLRSSVDFQLDLGVRKITFLNYPKNCNLRYSVYSNQVDSIIISKTAKFAVFRTSNVNCKYIEFESKLDLEVLSLVLNKFDTLVIEDFPNLSSIYSEFNNNLNFLKLSNLPKLTSFESIQDPLDILEIVNTPNLSYLKLFNNNLSYLHLTELHKLEYLEIELTKIKNLQTNNLKYLSCLKCYNNLLDSLNMEDLPKLENIYCKSNAIKSLELSKLPNLKVLNCSNNLIHNLKIKECINLNTIDCSENDISEFNDSLFLLNSLDISNNRLKQINLHLYPKITSVYCQGNELTMPFILKDHNNVSILNCSRNLIPNIHLNNLASLSKLICSDNQITSLDLIKVPKLEEIVCDSNSFEELTFENLNLKIIDVSYNKDLRYLSLINLPKLNSIFNTKTPLEFVISKDQWVFNNATGPFYGDLPIYNPNLKYICCSDKNITAIKSKLNSLGIQNCEVNSYCTFTPGSIFYSLIGNTILDADNNGCDSNDVKIPNVKFSITGGTESGTLIANSSGSYFFPFQTGTHTIQPSLENQTHFTVNPTSHTLSPPFSQNQYIQDFCFTPKDVISNIDLSISPKSPPARPGFNAQYSIVITNTGNQIENGIINFEFEGTKMDFVSSDLAPTNQSDESLSWNYIDLLPYETRKFNVEFRINSPFDNPPINAGDELVFSCNTTNHDFTLKQIVVGSYDPNDKTCLQGNAITPEMVGDYVHYMIRFENTGNYAAENIVVKDVIDTSKFDVSSLQITDSSHEAWARIKGNVVEFIFEKIELPFNDEENDGYITFKIKTKPNLDLGAELKNEANIYFDYNLPVLTNEAKTVVAIPDLIHDETETAHFEVFPNPTANTVGYLSSDLVYKAEVFSIDGRLLQSSLFPGNEIEVKHLPDGSYVLKIYTRNKVQVGRFVIE